VVIGSVTGVVIGSVTGVVIGSVTGVVIGSVTGVVIGSVAGVVIGSVTGVVIGSVVSGDAVVSVVTSVVVIGSVTGMAVVSSGMIRVLLYCPSVVESTQEVSSAFDSASDARFRIIDTEDTSIRTPSARTKHNCNMFFFTKSYTPLDND
jgi:hypothetical protein